MASAISECTNFEADTAVLRFVELWAFHATALLLRQRVQDDAPLGDVYVRVLEEVV